MLPLGQVCEDFGEPGTSKTILKRWKYREFNVFSTFASDASSDLAKAPRSLPETPPKHPKTLQRAPLELPRASPRRPRGTLMHTRSSPKHPESTPRCPHRVSRPLPSVHGREKERKYMLKTCFSMLETCSTHASAYSEQPYFLSRATRVAQ